MTDKVDRLNTQNDVENENINLSRRGLLRGAALAAAAGSVTVASASQSAAEQSHGAWNVMDAHPTGSVEFPTNDPNIPEIWLYTDKMSYSPGEEAIFYVHTTAKEFSYALARDGADMDILKEEKNLPV